MTYEEKETREVYGSYSARWLSYEKFRAFGEGYLRSQEISLRRLKKRLDSECWEADSYDPESPCVSLALEIEEAESSRDAIKEYLELAARLEKDIADTQRPCNAPEEGEFDERHSNHNRVVWLKSKADLARLYYTLQDNGCISTKAADFAMHFNDNKGNPVLPDFVDSVKRSQHGYSTSQGVVAVQKAIEDIGEQSRKCEEP